MVAHSREVIVRMQEIGLKDTPGIESADFGSLLNPGMKQRK